MFKKQCKLLLLTLVLVEVIQPSLCRINRRPPTTARTQLARGQSTALAGPQARIISGQPTTINSVPYLVNLRVDDNFRCGATLVRNNVVITAAHCVRNVRPGRMSVQAGSTLLSGTGQVRPVWKVITSPRFNPDTFDWDVAVLKLRQPLIGANIRPINLCSRRLRVGQPARISGWGLTEEDGTEPSDQVRTTIIRMVGWRRCLNSFRGQSSLTVRMICAGNVGDRDTCSGDSGGPLIVNNELCGITSWGLGCGNPQYPGVYTSVNALRRWIVRAINRP